jgi:hypothetical protein
MYNTLHVWHDPHSFHSRTQFAARDQPASRALNSKLFTLGIPLTPAYLLKLSHKGENHTGDMMSFISIAPERFELYANPNKQVPLSFSKFNFALNV